MKGRLPAHGGTRLAAGAGTAIPAPAPTTRKASNMPAPAQDTFSNPSELGGGNLKIADLEGHLVVIEAVDGQEVEVDTQRGVTQMLPCRVIVVDDVEHQFEPGWNEIGIFAVMLRAQLKRAFKHGKPSVVGVIGKGKAQPGKTAPWILDDANALQTRLARQAYTEASNPF